MKNKLTVIKYCLILASIVCLSACGTTASSDSDSGSNESSINSSLLGGSETVFDTSRQAFSHHFPSFTASEKTDFFIGESFFDEAWVTAPASTEARDGLGPYFNAVSCASCHTKDGRGFPATTGSEGLGLLLRLSIPGQSSNGGPKPEPNYGGQLQTFSINGIDIEGEVEISYATITGTYADGSSYSLEKPIYTIINPAYGTIPGDILVSPRVAPQMIGMGLLETIPEEQILEKADENDSNSDGISGKPNYVWDVEAEETVLGRFGWKANQPSIRQQTAGAFLGDIGITSPVFPSQNITSGQEEETAGLEHGGEPEIKESLFSKVVFYTQSLAVPERRNSNDETVLQGEALFETLKCSSCHTPSYTFEGDTIYPYTDLLLHDMGDDLADNRPDFEANGNEWRTPPLWGIGLIETVNGHTRFMHDGRARNLTEAVLWHGGEASASKEAFKALSESDRDALISFLESL